MAQSKLDHLRKIVRMMNSGITSLDHILYMGTTSKNKKGIVYQKESIEIKPSSRKKSSGVKSTKIKETIRTPPRIGTSCPDQKDKLLKRKPMKTDATTSDI